MPHRGAPQPTPVLDREGKQRTIGRIIDGRIIKTWITSCLMILPTMILPVSSLFFAGRPELFRKKTIPDMCGTED